MPLSLSTKGVADGCEIWLSSKGPAPKPFVSVFCIGALQMPDEQLMRLAGTIHGRHRDQPKDVLVWHIGADTPAGGLSGDVLGGPGATARIVTFLKEAGEYGLWWPETWRSISRYLLGRSALAGVAVFLIQDKADRAPRFWNDHARDDHGRTLEEEFARLRRLGLKAELTVVGEGGHSFKPGLRCIGLDQLIQELQAPEQAWPVVDMGFTVEIDGLGKIRATVASGWTLDDLKRAEWRHALFPNERLAVAGSLLLLHAPGIDAAQIRVRKKP